MFEGYGVGLTVTELVPARPEAPPAAGSPRLSDVLPVDAWSAREKALELGRVRHIKNVLAAYEVALIAGLAADRPASVDLPSGRPGAASAAWGPAPGEEQLAGVSEFFPDELALVLGCSRASATALAATALTLRHRLPATWAALADGLLDWPRARAIAAELGLPARETDPRLVAEVEAVILRGAGDLSVPQLRAATRRELLRRDAAAADRRAEQVQACADVIVRPAGDGMAELAVFLPQPLAAAIRETVDTCARMEKQGGDPRRIGQLRVRALADLVLRPWDGSRMPVTAALTVVAPLATLTATGSDAAADVPAEVDGQPITAAALRRLLEELDALCPGGLQPPAGGRLDIALVDPSGRLRATVTRRELERLARRGCSAHPGAGCACPVLDRPPPADRYEPTPAQHRFVQARDRTCRMPGCRHRSGWADLDHVVPHGDGGSTDCGNLCCLCRRHHRLKTHAPGWSFTLDDDGVLTVTTPSGVTRVTRPPGMGRPGAAPPERLAATPIGEEAGWAGAVPAAAVPAGWLMAGATATATAATAPTATADHDPPPF